MIAKKYLLKDGSVYWHKLYYAFVPKWMTRYSPPGGSYNYAFYAYRPHTYVIELYDHVKYFIQRGIRGYSDRDVWGWCSHHSVMMVGVLKQLHKYKHGHPVGLTPKTWDRKLAVMQEGFQAAIDEENDFTSYRQLPKKMYRKLVFSRRKKLMLALKYFRTYYYNLWD